MEIRSLQNEEISVLTKCFNQVFADYFVKVEATRSYLSNRWHAAGVVYDLSLGAYVKDQLIGFLIHATDPEKNEAYNAAAGVVPAYRGQGLVGKLYDAALPRLREAKIQRVSLEVITKNAPAIKAYTRSGFNIYRKLHCFKGRANASSEPEFKVSRVTELIPGNYEGFLDFDPSWENRFAAILRRREACEVHEVYSNEQLIGFGIVVPDQNYIPLFAIKKGFRNSGAGNSLFHELTRNIPEVRINNIESTAESTLNFLNKMELENHIDQFEMIRDL